MLAEANKIKWAPPKTKAILRIDAIKVAKVNAIVVYLACSLDWNHKSITCRGLNNRVEANINNILNNIVICSTNIISSKKAENKLSRGIDKDLVYNALKGLGIQVFDEFEKDRNKIFESIPKMLQNIKNINGYSL